MPSKPPTSQSGRELLLEPTLGELADTYHEHPDLPEGRLANGCWKCIGCGIIVAKHTRWLNWCSSCGYEMLD